MRPGPWQILICIAVIALLFGFCREAIRRRVKPLVQCFCKRREED